MSNQAKIKVNIAQLLEVSYYQDKKMTAAIVAEKGHYKLRIDKDGNATLTGKAGSVRFNASETLLKLGANFKGFDIYFHPQVNGEIGYTASYSFAAVTISVAGTIDIEELILKCSGLACNAARAFKSRRSVLREAEFKSVVR